MLISCAGCEKPILDKFLLNVLERTWHADCVRCYDCHHTLSDKCFSREGKLFCRNDFFRRYGTKCGGCSQGISPSDLVRKARDRVFHLNCFTCMVCRKQLSTGEELYVLDDNKFICKDDYMSGKNSHEDPPTCEKCDAPLTVEHILLSCQNMRFRPSSFTNLSMSDILKDDTSSIDVLMRFLKRNNFLKRL
ncbi:hypothetical protein M8J77_025682 [Diaphorina citri]|nr:hypothetical protein M8J77_025682 [Diaphorina citri]